MEHISSINRLKTIIGHLLEVKAEGKEKTTLLLSQVPGEDGTLQLLNQWLQALPFLRLSGGTQNRKK